MADPASFGRDDLAAAIAAGVLGERQAAGLLALAAARRRHGAAPDDEPFVIFRGFAEIFVATGLALMFMGLYGGLVLLSSGLNEPRAGGMAIAAGAAGLAFALGWPLARARRMVLPSMVLVLALAMFTAAGAGLALGETPWPRIWLGGALAALCATGAWYGLFRLPFALLVVAASGLAVLMSLIAMLMPEPAFAALRALVFREGPLVLLDLRQAPLIAGAVFGFGIVTFAAAMAHDLRDPLRVRRQSDCGFWLHLAAAPLLINPVGLTLLNIDGAAGRWGLAGAVSLIALIALLIDRRSFLTAGLVYVGALAFALMRGGVDVTLPVVLAAMGATVTLLGIYWAPLRGGLLRRLPAFPGKRHLPPWGA